MSRIPKLPTLVNKENRPGIGRSAPLTTRTLVSSLSDADKKNLLLNHTKPMQSGPAKIQNGPTKPLYSGQSNEISKVVPAPRLKRAQTVPSASMAPPPKIAKIEKKPLAPAPRIAPYDFKAKFNNLLDKHKVMKTDYSSLKEQHDELTEEYEKLKESAQTCVNERDILKQQLLEKSAEYDKMKIEYTALKQQHDEITKEYEKVKEDAQSSACERDILKQKLLEKTTECDKMKIACDLQKHEIEELQQKTRLLEEITTSLKKKSEECDKLQTDHNDLNRRYNSLKEEVEALRVLSEHLKKVSIQHDKLQLDYKETQLTLTKSITDTESLQTILAAMYKEQRDLRNTVQDLKGNIRVYCRIRPPLESEASKPCFNINVVDACSIEVEKVELCNSTRKGKHAFTFDGIFTPYASQEDVFAEVSSMVQSALDGYNVCIFAYGQTGSGKTFTMEGGCGKEQYGIIPRAFNMIFTSMEDLKKMGWELTIRASFLEIYNEVIYDLLNSSKDQITHEIKMVNSKGGDVYVSNLKEEEVKSSHDFIRMMIFAQRNRQTAATLNNERSSRSHSVAQIKISAIHDKRKEKFTSSLNLVDLAGSESGKTTQRMDETKHINRSLSELSKVILSLQTNQAHIPYRNSKLTHLLMPSLGGNSKTLMLVNINQFDECFSETLNSLRFATKVNSCRTIKAKKNLTMVDS